MLEVKDFILSLIHSKFLDFFLKRGKERKKKIKKQVISFIRKCVFENTNLDWEGRKKCVYLTALNNLKTQSLLP